MDKQEKKSLFSASFEQSQRVVQKIFGKEILSLARDQGVLDSSNVINRLFVIVPGLMLGIPMVGMGIFYPRYTDQIGEVHYLTWDIWLGVEKFSFLSYILIGVLTIWGIVIIVNIFPMPNFAVRRVLGGFLLLGLMVSAFLAMAPMMLGLGLGSGGWLGFIFSSAYGSLFFLKSMINRKNKIRKTLFRSEEPKSSSKVISLWEKVRKTWWLIILLIFLNMFTLRLGMWGEETFWGVIWVFFTILWFLMVTGFSYVTLEPFIATYYFAKYANQYREKWQLTDEQWYGKRKAKRIAKKEKRKKK